jgi:vinculin
MSFIVILCDRVEKSGLQQPAPTVTGRLEQARRWLEAPAVDDRGLGRQAITLVVEEGRRIAAVLPEADGQAVASVCHRVDADAKELEALCRAGEGGSSRAVALAQRTAEGLNALKEAIRTALVDRVVLDFVDTASAFKHFRQAVTAPPRLGEPAEHRERALEAAAQRLTDFSSRVVATAKMVAVGSATADKRAAEALLAQATQLESLTPQLTAAGRIRAAYPESKPAEEHFENLMSAASAAAVAVRDHCDEVTDSLSFVERSLVAAKAKAAAAAAAAAAGEAVRMVEAASAEARLASRVVHVARKETDNTEDDDYRQALIIATDSLQGGQWNQACN